MGSFLTFPHFTKVPRPQFLDEVDLRPGDLVLVSGGVLKSVALPFPGLRLGAGFGQLATEALAVGALVTRHKVLQRVERLPGGDKVSSVKRSSQ